MKKKISGEQKKKPAVGKSLVKLQIAAKQMQENQKENNNKKQQDSQPNTRKFNPKRPFNATDEENLKVSEKKRKIVDKENIDEEAEVVELAGESKENKIDIASINKGIFAIFNKLQDSTKQNRQKHVNDMISLLGKEEDANKRTATCAYALKRLVRCTGADDKAAVATNAGYINSILRGVPGLDPIELLNLLKRELPFNSNQKGREESLAAVGQLITILSIMQSQFFEQPSAALIAMVYPILIAQLKGREYLVSLCVDIMSNSFKKVSAPSFETHVWPLLEPELNRPIATQKLHICDLLLAVHLNYPMVLPLQQFQSILWRKQTPQYQQLFELYLKSSIMQGYGTLSRLGKFLATCSNEAVLTAWQTHVTETLPTKHITVKSYIIETLSNILMNFQESKPNAHIQLEQMFAVEPLVNLVLDELRTSKKLNKAKGNIKPAQLQMRYICRKFETAMLVTLQHHFKQDACKLAILRPLLQKHMQLDDITQTPRFSQTLLSKLSEQGLNQMYDFYFARFTSSEEMTQSNREHCLRQMQQLNHSNRKTQLDFLMKASIYHLNDQLKPCTVDDAALFSRQAAARCEEAFFNSLVNKIGTKTAQLVTLNEQLRSLLLPLSQKLTKSKYESKLRVKMTNEIRQVWEKVQNLLDSPASMNNKTQELSLIFDTLIMFLGLAMLTPSNNVGLDVIEDFFICKQNAMKSKSQSKESKRKSTTTESEPKWQSVLTDALLQLLLQTGNYWRQFVNSIAGTLIPQLDKDNLEQILEMLDMNRNPFADKSWADVDADEDGIEEDNETTEDENENENADDDEEEDEDSDSDDDDKDGEKDDDDQHKDDEDGDEDNDSESDSDDEEDEDEEKEAADNDNEATNLELVRENVRKALQNGETDDNDDANSIDWNDVTEEQGERLNKALESAFQMRKPKGNSQQSKSSKRPPKSERITETALLHFRVRVLDLVELFITLQPQQNIILDALVCIQQVFKHCVQHPNLKPLAEATKKTLRSLLNQRITYNTSKQNKEPIIDCIKSLMEQQELEPQANANSKLLAKPIQTKGELALWRNRCVAYLVSHFDETDVTNSPIWPVLQSFAQDWAGRRNSPYQLGTFDAILSTPWTGINNLMENFCTLLTASPLCSFRRVQLLGLLLKHCRRVCNISGNKQKTAKKFHKAVGKYVPHTDKDRTLQKKLLTQLEKLMAEP